MRLHPGRWTGAGRPHPSAAFQLFDVEILFSEDGEVTGDASCRVQTESLTKPIAIRIPVSRTIESFDLMDLAGGLIDALGK